MTPYASLTGTLRTVAALKAAGWGAMVSPTTGHSPAGWQRYALDNGAWTAHQLGVEWPEAPFLRLVERHGPGAQFVVVPDIVGGGMRSFARSYAWLPRLESCGARRLLFPVQDNMNEDDVREVLSPAVGIFLGGSTEFKLDTMRSWGELARYAGAYFHVGRVNTARRVRMCAAAGADSFDGSSVTRFLKTLPLLDGARRQRSWVW